MDFATFAYDTLGFLLRAFIFVLVIGAILRSATIYKPKEGKIRVTDMSDELTRLKRIFKGPLPKKKNKDNDEPANKISGKSYLLNFKGSITAIEVDKLKREVDAVIQGGDSKTDKVIITIESPGGAVTGYGYAASQIERLRQAGFEVIASVDQVAASGGYLMASVANKIVASKFAIIGSIGVVSQMPNFSRLLDKAGIDYEQITAGEHKRTLSMVKPNSDEAREKFTEELKAIHTIFKRHVHQYRPELNIDEIATGEYWLGEDALEKGLIDAILTSDELIMNEANVEDRQLLKVEYKRHKPIGKRLKGATADIAVMVMERFQAKVHNPFENIR